MLTLNLKVFEDLLRIYQYPYFRIYAIICLYDSGYQQTNKPTNAQAGKGVYAHDN